jgi:hypothetical protein
MIAAVGDEALGAASYDTARISMSVRPSPTPSEAMGMKNIVQDIRSMCMEFRILMFRPNDARPAAPLGRMLNALSRPRRQFLD